MNKSHNSSQKWIESGGKVWIKAKGNMYNPFSDAFLEGRVKGIDKKVSITMIDGPAQSYEVTFEECLKLTYGTHDVADMVDLEELNEPELLYNIKRRYLSDQVFTYCGPTLVVVNPYAQIHKLFNDSVLLDYQSCVFSETLEYKSLPPHIYALAAFVLWQLFDNKRSQSIVISGESGAGKTENTKHCLKFLASLSRNVKDILADPKNARKVPAAMIHKLKRNASTKLVGMEERILGCNQVLEAFGNSKTIRNDNSSRFGKLVLLQYGDTHIDIRSASITSYLLQKSRIVTLAPGERNYHVFYYFLSGMDAERRKNFLLLKGPQDYFYLNQSPVTDIPGVSDLQRFKELQMQLGTYFTPEEINCLLKIISAVLHTGNITFRREDTKSNEQSAIVNHLPSLKNVAQLLQVSAQALQDCLEWRSRKLGGNVIKSPLKLAEALATRDSFAKNMYEKTFGAVVHRLNEKIEVGKESGERGIGLLDIFGFEVLAINSLEQFFINFANQKLQQLYVSYIFKQEQNEFLREGLKEFSHDIGFQDNKPIIDLFENYPLGIFHLVNQSSELNNPDQSLPDTIKKNHPKNQFLQLPKSRSPYFTVTHSCSSVEYAVLGFTSKNKDQFPQQLLDIVSNSSDNLMRSLLFYEQQAVQKPKEKSRASNKFLGSKFLNQMNRLTQELYSCDCHFVRCIKPNSMKAAKLFNSESVLQSLRYLGVLDSIIIRKLGYIYRRPFKELVKKFFELDSYIFAWTEFAKGKSEDDFKEPARVILNKHAPTQLQNKEILFGNKKILIKESALNYLESLVKERKRMRIASANKIIATYKHSCFRSSLRVSLRRWAIFKHSLKIYLAKLRYSLMIKKIVRIEKTIRKFLWFKRLEKIKEQATHSVTVISAYFRMKKQRKIFLKMKENVLKMQSHIRAKLNLLLFLRVQFCKAISNAIVEKSWLRLETSKATIIQSRYRGYRDRKAYLIKFAQIRRKLRVVRFQQKVSALLFANRMLKLEKGLKRFIDPIVRLQSIVRRKFARRLYLRLKKNTILIQKAFRHHLRKRSYLKSLWESYQPKLIEFEGKKLIKLKDLGVSLLRIESKASFDCASKRIIQGFPSQLRDYFVNQPPKSSSLPNWSFNQSPNFQKNTVQVYIADYDVLTNSQQNWMKLYCELKEEMGKRNEYPIRIELDGRYTLVLSNKWRLHRICNQSTSIIQKAQKAQKTSIISIEKADLGCIIHMNSSLIINSQRRCYRWESGAPTKVADAVISAAVSRRSETLLTISDVGKVQEIDRSEDGSFNKSINHLKMPEPIKSVAVSLEFSLFLSKNGVVYGSGTNLKGQLGLGRSSRAESIQPNAYFIKAKENIESISVGIGHSVAKSKLGYVYTWGDNCFSQVTQKDIPCYLLPVLMESEKGVKVKAIQAIAGARSTYILSETLKITGWGCNSIGENPNSLNGSILNIPLNALTQPRILSLLKNTTLNKQLFEVHMHCVWDRHVSILQVNAIQGSRCRKDTQQQVIYKYCKMLARDWAPEAIYSVYSEWAEGVLQLSDARRFKLETKAEKVMKKDSLLQQLKALMELRKTSKVFRDTLRQKMSQGFNLLKTRIRAEWTSEDEQLQVYLLQNQHVL